MPSFPPNSGWPLSGQSDGPSNDWGTPYTPDLVQSMGLDTQPPLSHTEMFNYLLRFYHSHAPAPFVGPAHSLPSQAPGLNLLDLSCRSQEIPSNGMTASFNEPSMQSQIANMHGINQALPNIDPSMQDPTPVQAQERDLELEPAPRTPQTAPRRGRDQRARRSAQRARVSRCEWKNCDKTFNRKGDRDRHVKSLHLSPKSLECPEDCGRKFSRKDNLRDHVSKVHGGDNNRSPV